MQCVVLFRQEMSSVWEVHLELITRAYFILSSIAAKALIRIVGKGQACSWTLMWPLADPKLAFLCSQKCYGQWFHFIFRKVFLLHWSAVRGAESSSTMWICCFVLPDSLQRRFTRLVTQLWSSSALTIQSTRKGFTSATPAPSSRTHCTHASDQRGPEGAVRGSGGNEGAPMGGASLMLGNLRPPRSIRHNGTDTGPPTAPQLQGALALSTDCEE